MAAAKSQGSTRKRTESEEAEAQQDIPSIPEET